MTAQAETGQNVQSIPIGLLRHSLVSPRGRFDQAKLEKLATSLKNTNGPLEPLMARPHTENGRTVFEVVRGERRYRAAIIAKLETLPVEVRHLSDSEAKRLALIDTLERERLSDLERVEAVLDLLCFELGLDAGGVQGVLNKMQHHQQKHKSLESILSGRVAGAMLAEQVETVLRVFDEIGGTWRNFLTNALPLLNLPPDLLAPLRQGDLPSKTVALQLARLNCPAQRATLMQDLKSNTWSTRNLKSAIDQTLGQSNLHATMAEKLRHLAHQLERSTAHLDVLEVAKCCDHLETLILSR